MTEGSELEHRTPDPTSFAMDSYVDLLAEDVECANMIKWWTARRALVQERLRDILGDHEIGTVNGQDVVSYAYQNRFNTSAFKKKYPNLYRAYMTERVQEVLDEELLKHSRPDLYKEFQVRAMRVTYDPPGSK